MTNEREDYMRRALALAREAAGERLPARPAQVMLVAGRREGRQLFTGSLLTLRYFLWPFGLVPTEEPCLLRGLDGPGDLRAEAATLAGLVANGEAAWARKR